MTKLNSALEVTAVEASTNYRAPRALAEPSPYEIRTMLRDLVLRDLRGPAGAQKKNSVGRERITERYLVGSLAPKGAKLVTWRRR